MNQRGARLHSHLDFAITNSEADAKGAVLATWNDRRRETGKRAALMALNFIFRRKVMPRRPVKVTQADLARAIRAAKEAGASAVSADVDGVIRIALTSSAALGTEARLMFDILHYTFLRLGDAHRFGPPHLRQIVRKMAVQIATEKSWGNTTVTVPVHPEFAESLRAARAANIIGAEVFTGKLVRGRVFR